MNITTPPQLESASKALDFIQTVKDIMALKPEYIQSIEDNIRECYSLNDTERKKAEDAHNLVDQYHNLLDFTNRAIADLELDREQIFKDRKDFEIARQSQLDDIALKLQALSDDIVAHAQDRLALDETNRQLSVAQATVNAAAQRNVEREEFLNEKEKLLDQREQDLDSREQKVVSSEARVNAKLSKLKEIMA